MPHQIARHSRIRLIFATSIALWVCMASTAEQVQQTGLEIVVDDALFTGCYHNAFEGEVLQPSDGVYKTGPQAVQRTKAVLTGAGTADRAMHLKFDLGSAPKGSVDLVIRGIDDRFEHTNPLDVTVNGKQLAEALVFPKNQNIDNGLNQRYFLGWEDKTVTIPKGVLKKGENTLTIANTADAFAATNWRYAVVDHVTFKFKNETQLTVEREGWPIYYYGLSEGAEGHLWPAVNFNDKVALVNDAAIEYNFYVTFPNDIPLGKQGPFTEVNDLQKRDVLVHFATDAPIRVTNLEGQEVAGTKDSGGMHFTQPLGRIIKFSTPHPAQGIRLFLTGKSAFEGKTLTVWWSIDGVEYTKKQYPLRSVDLKPVENRDSIDFLLSLWGGGVPKEAAALDKYITLLKGAGFNHQFTGDTADLNKKLQDSGFDVYPRYGWFGHQFKITEETQQYVAINAKGDPLPKDFCPLHILDNQDHPEIGKFFKRAERFASLPNIDGLCVDYETAPAWCWCDRCLAEFTTVTGTDIAGRADVAPGGEHADAYLDFGRSLNRRLLEQVKAIMLEQNPDLKYYCLASAADLPTYWYDGRERGRHSVEELVKFADAVYGSHYCYETPGGLASVIPTVNTIQRLAVESGRSVDVNLITPVATTVSEHPRYRGVHLRPDFTRMLILLTGSSGGGGVSLFRGDCMDGEQYVACRQAISELVSIREYINGLNRTFEIEITPTDKKRPIYDTEMAQNLMSRLVWRPAQRYQYDAVQLMKNKMGRDRMLLLFNYSQEPVTFNVRVQGLYDESYELKNFATGEALGTHGRLALEAGEPTVTVPPRDCLMVRMTTVEK